MKNKALIRTLVFGAILAWPALESYRCYAVRKQLAASEEQLQLVTQKVVQVRAKHAQYAKASSAAKP